MARANEISITLPAELVEKTLALAKEQNCTVGQLIQESLHRYEAVDRLNSAIESGEDRSEALESFLEDYVVRTIHEYRAERHAQERENQAGERKAS